MFAQSGSTLVGQIHQFSTVLIPKLLLHKIRNMNIGPRKGTGTHRWFSYRIHFTVNRRRPAGLVGVARSRKFAGTNSVTPDQRTRA